MSLLRWLIVAIVVVIGIVAGVLVACLGDRWANVEPGEYVAVESTGTASADSLQVIEKLRIDRSAGAATLTLLDGSTITTQFGSRDKALWPAGCPTNLYSTRMEVLDLRIGELVVGATTYPRPVLVRDCPEDPLRVVLRSDGEIGGGGSACMGASWCVRFARECAYERPPVDQELPRSMKGYELYSWNANGQWLFTLITGTDRLKTLAEVTRCQNTVEGDWIKITVRGADDLEAALAFLPSGSYLGWRGSLGPGADSLDTGVQLELPPSRIVSEVESTCSDLGIELYVAW